jgi:putative endonuclease
MNKQLLGATGEEAVSRYLQARGYRVIDRNWRIRAGEIDLIALSPDGQFVFVEVKSRTSLTYGDPLEAITALKAHRLQKLALAWLVMRGEWGSNYRIDCAGVLISRDGRLEIDYRKGVL